MSDKNRCGGKRCNHMEQLGGTKACAIKRQGKAGMCPCGVCLVRVMCKEACSKRFQVWHIATNNGRKYLDNHKRFRIIARGDYPK
jgi:hypothetical protein